MFIHALHMPASIAGSLGTVASLQTFLANGGRFLLTFTMALFLAYLLFMLSSIFIAIAARRVSSASEWASRKHARREPTAHARRGGRLALVSDDDTAAEPAAPVSPADAVPEAGQAETLRGA